MAFVNAAKKGRFSVEEKRAMLECAFKDMPNVHVDVSETLLAGYAAEKSIGTLVKGARSATDFDYEMSLSLINRSLEAELDSVILPTKAEYMHISSTMVSEMIRYGRDYEKLVPPGCAELIRGFVNEK